MTTTTPATSTPTTTTPAATSATQNSSALNQLTNNFSTFLTLLTTQLKNQDPTSPMDSNQFTQQLVEFSQVEQQINTNSNLSTLITQGQTQIGAYATSYLGKSVSVTNANGKVVYSGPGETAAGNHQFIWNGKDNNGNQLDDGTYTLAVTAQTASGGAVTSTISSNGIV